jgi:hypothetical protein
MKTHQATFFVRLRGAAGPGIGTAILIMAPCRLGCGFAASAGGIKCQFSGNKGRYSFDSIGSGEKSFS